MDSGLFVRTAFLLEALAQRTSQIRQRQVICFGSVGPSDPALADVGGFCADDDQVMHVTLNLC